MLCKKKEGGGGGELYILLWLLGYPSPSPNDAAVFTLVINPCGSNKPQTQVKSHLRPSAWKLLVALQNAAKVVKNTHGPLALQTHDGFAGKSAH
jgi:hypothetical protein